jgi:hypothetical protein
MAGEISLRFSFLIDAADLILEDELIAAIKAAASRPTPMPTP